MKKSRRERAKGTMVAKFLRANIDVSFDGSWRLLQTRRLSTIPDAVDLTSLFLWTAVNNEYGTQPSSVLRVEYSGVVSCRACPADQHEPAKSQLTDRTPIPLSD